MEVTAGDDNDDVGAVHRRRELGRHELERREPLGQAFDVEPPTLACLGDARLVAIVQAEAIAKQPQVGHESDAAQTRADGYIGVGRQEIAQFGIPENAREDHPQGCVRPRIVVLVEPKVTERIRLFFAPKG